MLPAAPIRLPSGAMMALAHDATGDRERRLAHPRSDRDTLTRAVAEIADDEDLSKRWAERGSGHALPAQDPDRGERRVSGNSHLTLAGVSTNRMIAMKLHAGRPPDLADLDILLKDAGVERHGATPYGCTS